MWQVLLAAAVAGSGLIANRFLSPNADPNTIVSHEAEEKCDEYNKSDSEMQSSTTVFDGDGEDEGSVFRFSSSGSGAGSGSRFGSKKAQKKLGNGGNGEGMKNTGIGKSEKKCGVLGRCRSGRKLGFCVKKRRISKNAPGKCESCSSKGNSFFSHGLGVGLVYMMSAGKAEISRLNTAMDETAKVVQELKVELQKRKSSRGLHFSSSKSKINANQFKIRGRNIHDSGLFIAEEGECASSVLTEEPQQEVMEMDRLEAELESELEKLPWCSIEASGLDGRKSDFCENEASAEEFCQPDGQNFSLYQSSGVLPSELDQKLCHLLIEQQESQIVELESELHQSQSKLCEKETELQALKDCVRRLTEFSLATVSDEETETQVEDEKAKEGECDIKMVPESQRSVVGMKRAMEFESYSCHMK